jgi:scyllo-inositol 2-dehydrogenase (NADP+)
MAKRKKWFSKPGDIKVGVIGYGGAFNMGKAHLTAMKAAGMKPFAVCDVDASRLEVAREDFPGIETYTDLSKMLKQSDVNLIVHITPHNLHYKLAAQCLRAGKHVVTEKPFALNTAECDRLIKLAEEKKLMLSTYHNRHWDGHIVTAVKKVVEQKVVGDVVAVEAKMGGYGMPKEWWRSSRSVSGGILYDWGCHILEYCLQVIQSDIVEVSGFAVEGFWAEQAPKSHPWKNDMNEDHATAVVRFANGCRLNLTISQIDSDERPYFVNFMGTEGSYQMNMGKWKLRKPYKTKRGFKEIEGKNAKTTPALTYYKNVAQHMCGKEDLVITPQWARRPIHVLDLAARSAKAGRAMKAKYA